MSCVHLLRGAVPSRMRRLNHKASACTCWIQSIENVRLTLFRLACWFYVTEVLIVLSQKTGFCFKNTSDIFCDILWVSHKSKIKSRKKPWIFHYHYVFELGLPAAEI